MRYFVTSDQHYGHGNIIKYANRPFSSSQEMNEELIRRFNERVKTEDFTFIIGDFCFKSGVGCEKSEYWMNRLNGQKLVIRGNHDNQNSTKTIIDCMHITFAQKRINLVHKPDHANPDFEINLVGHVHQNWRVRTFAQHYKINEEWYNKCLPSDRQDIEFFLSKHFKNQNSDSVLLNIGVDQNKFYPITLDEAIGQVIRFKKGITI